MPPGLSGASGRASSARLYATPFLIDPQIVKPSLLGHLDLYDPAVMDLQRNKPIAEIPRPGGYLIYYNIMDAILYCLILAHMLTRHHIRETSCSGSA